MNSTEIAIGEYLIKKLYERGVRHIFGIPGDYVLGFYKLLEESKIRVINTCDEQGAGFAADAYARVHGMGAVCITYAVGGMKVANTTAQAFAEESPVVIISGAPGVQEQRGDPMLHHKIKTFETQYKVFEQLTVACARLDNPETACHEINRVLSAAICFRRPVYIELPRDMTSKKIVPVEEKISAPETDRRPLNEAVREAAGMINAARRPVIVAGVEIMRYNLEKPLLKLAEKANIAIVSSILSKAVIDEGHPLFLGIYQGGMSLESVSEYVKGSDCVILLGMFMTDLNLGIFTDTLHHETSIFSTSEKTSIKYHTYHSVYLNSFLDGLLQADISPKAAPDMPRRIKMPKENAVVGRPITIERLCRLLEAKLDSNSFLIADTGDALFASSDIKIPRAVEFMASAYYASLGFAVPACVGVQLALPSTRPVAIVGDGAFQMTGMELATAVRYNLNPIVIVLNNYGYGTERPMLDGSFNDVSEWRYSLIPQVFGAGKGFDIRTEDEFENAMNEASSITETFCLLEVHLDPHDISPSLKRLTEALGKRVK